MGYTMSIKMGPDLKSYNIEELAFFATVSLDSTLIAQIQKVSPPDDSGDSLFVDHYKHGKTNYKSWVWVIKGSKDTDKYDINFHYEVATAAKAPKDIPKISRLIEIVSVIEKGVQFDCRANFWFGARSKIKPIIPLPLRLLELPDMPFDEVHGLHLVKRNGKGKKYEVMLDFSGRGTIAESVFFGYHGGIRETLADEIINEAVKISSSFILREE